MRATINTIAIKLNVTQAETIRKILSELEELESKAAKWDDPQTQLDLELASAVKTTFEKWYFARTRTGNVIAIDEQELLAWYKHDKSGNNE